MHCEWLEDRPLQPAALPDGQHALPARGERQLPRVFGAVERLHHPPRLVVSQQQLSLHAWAMNWGNSGSMQFETVIWEIGSLNPRPCAAFYSV